jgi:hypothetical protein
MTRQRDNHPGFFNVAFKERPYNGVSAEQRGPATKDSPP